MMKEQSGLVFEHVTVKRKNFTLSDVSFCLPKGFILGIAGENGAGKSTLLSAIADRYTKFSGSILVDGMDLQANREEALNRIGFISPGQPLFEEMTALENATLLGAFYSDFDQNLFKEKMKQFEVSSGSIVKNMSLGQRIRFLFAFAIAHKSTLYLFDEATAGMDLVYRKEFFRLLKQIMDEQEASAVLVTHLAEEIQLQVDYKLILENGKLKSFSENIR